MSSFGIAGLGAIAGLTIYLGLPLGLVGGGSLRLRTALNALAIGILLFLLWDVLSQAWEPIDAGLSSHDFGSAIGFGLVMAAGIGVGLLTLLYADQRARRKAAVPVAAGAGELEAAVALGAAAGPARPGIAPPAGAVPSGAGLSVSAARQLALTIAIGIGLHNFAEGLAIGASAAEGKLGFAILLIIGFGLHNATEGFGIIAPLNGTRPTWRYLALLGIIGGGPTFLGTVLGQAFHSELVAIAFLSLAAGSILYVVIELLAVARRSAMKNVVTWFIFLGLLAGFATDAIVTIAGA